LDPDARKRIPLDKYVTNTVGMPTLTDILSELAQPGRDPRERFEVFEFAEGVEQVSDLKPGMRLPGIVTNVTAFGAFVDVGVHQDGLVHISHLADRFVKNPKDVVKLRQKVMVTVLDVDIERKRVSLSMKTPEPEKRPAPAERRAPQTTAPPRTEKRETQAKPSAPPRASSRRTGRDERAERKPAGDTRHRQGRDRKGSAKPPRRGREQAGSRGRSSDARTERPPKQTALNNPFVKFFQDWNKDKKSG
jgi:uncharacterized protein